MELKEAIIQEITNVKEKLYRGETREGIASMQPLISDLTRYISKECREEVQSRILNDVLIPAMNAMQEQDGIELADILQYELMPIIEGQ